MRRGVSTSLIAIAIVAASVGVARAQTLDHFLVFKGTEAPELPRFTPITHITAVDPFGEWHWAVVKPVGVCDPASVDSNDPSAPSHPDHLEGYKVKRVSGTAKFARLAAQHVSDQFGELTLDFIKPERLMIVSATDTNGPPPAPTAPAVDNFTCYKVHASGNAAKFTPVLGVVVEDEFGTIAFDFLKPQSVCLPTNVQDGTPGAETHPDDLTCYKAKPRTAFTPIRVFTANQLSADALDLRKPVQVCVPSHLSLAGPTPSPTTTPGGTPTGETPTPTLSVTPTPTLSRTPTPTTTRSTTPTPSRTPSPTPTATPISRTCNIGGTDSRLAFQVKNAPFVGNIRVTGSITGSQTMVFAPLDANGVRQVTVPASSIQFDPIVINVPFNDPIRLCVTPTGIDGAGKIDCDGGEPGINITTQQDHDTSSAPGANGGLPQDPECNDTRTLPDGGISSACLESGVSTCNPSSPHPGACNSPVQFLETGTYGSGHERVAEYLTLRQVSNVGPDGVQCTDDDTYSAPISLSVFLTTGIAHTTVFDTNDIADNLLDNQAPDCSNCITEVMGAPRSCNLINGNGGVTNLKLASAFPVVDLPSVGDAAVTVELRCQ